MNRLISRQELSKAANQILKYLKERQVSTASDLHVLLGEKVILGTGQELIEVLLSPSNFGTSAYTISYATPPKGIPLEVKINRSLGYSQIIAKGTYTLPGYKEWVQDPWGNVVRYKALFTTEIDQLKQELEGLMLN